MKLSYAVCLCAILFSLTLQAQEKKPFSGEAEAGALIVSGNNDSESYNAKTKETYTEGQNVYTTFGRYLKTNSLGVESARNWEAGVRYERELNDYFSLYIGQKAESDVFNGYIQRDSSEFGVKYFLTKNDSTVWIAELGYRYQKTNPTGVGVITYDSLGRLYTEINEKVNKTVSFKYWAEYLPNFTDSDAYLANTEASLNVMLNSIFSLKIGYLLQYQNVIPATATKRSTTTTTMNLVAKF